MITFFRKIRQSLLVQNRITRYVVYAMGEIVLVVIGILIALQVNNWNENRKAQEAEQRLLKALLEEFESNLDILDKAIALNDSNISSSLTLANYTGPSLENFDEKKLSESMVGVFKFDPLYIPNRGTIDEVINSGRLSILSDPELRKAISSWKADLEFIKNQESYVVARRDLAHEFFLKYGNFRRHLNLIDESLVEVTPSRFPNNDFKFLENQEFESQLFLFIVASKGLSVGFYLPQKKKIQSIIELIKQGLK